MGWAGWVLIGWLVLAAIVVVLMVALGRASKLGDEDLERRGATRLMAAARRANRRRHGERRSSDALQAARFPGPDRRHRERREGERRADPTWLDEPAELRRERA